MHTAANNDKLKIALLNIHGLIRGHDLQLGYDADTGGQTLYVLELAQALSKQPQVAEVLLITRRIVDDTVSADYAKPLEQLNAKLRIVRITAGPDQYIAKEQIWDFLDTFADNLVDFFRQQAFLPDILHSHYADAGLVAANIANQLGIPLIHTGHSLGRVKRRRLMASGLELSQLEQQYNIGRRIEAEEITLATAERVITSTHQEIEEQYELYDHYQPAQMRIVPPGTNVQQFTPPTGKELQSGLFKRLTRHLYSPEKPLILALSRPDKRKNIIGLIEAFGQSTVLQQRANLLIIAGTRDDIDDLDHGAQEVFHELLVAIDRYDLYGKVVMPKQHRRDEVPLIYRIAAATKGVFVNPALTEPFGLTLIEAAASGLPIVATEDGGPRDIIANCANGELIDPLEVSTIIAAIEKLLTDPVYWQQCQQNGLAGVSKHYSWDAHAKRYLEIITPIAARTEKLHRQPVERRKEQRDERALVSDLDLNLLGDDASLQELLGLLRQHRKSTKFVIATGRRLDQALKLMKRYRIPEPDILISSSGSEIYYAPKLTPDTGWAKHIDHLWLPKRVTELLDQLPGLQRQPKAEQSQFKRSYYINPEQIDIEEIKSLLHREELSVHVQLAFGQYLDILPLRASKGMALRFVADRWQMPLERICVAGGSGADEDMMRGNTLAVVVANRHHEELSQLEDHSHIYFARKPYAAGIIEAIEYYDFFNTTSVSVTGSS